MAKKKKAKCKHTEAHHATFHVVTDLATGMAKMSASLICKTCGADFEFVQDSIEVEDNGLKMVIRVQEAEDVEAETDADS